MAINYRELVDEAERVLALVKDADVGGARRTCLSSTLAQLIQSARIRARPSPADENLHLLHKHASFAQQDLFNLLNLIHRVAWMRARVADGTMPEALFDQFATADVDMFHVEFRSVFDYLARALAPFAQTEVPDSFNKLRERIARREGYADAMGKELADLVTSCAWFGYLKDSRDDLIHEGDLTLIFPHEERVLFQTYGPRSIRINFPPVMFNENVVDFEVYAGMWLARLYAYLERWATTMFRISDIEPRGEPLLCSDGVEVAIAYIQWARAAFAAATASEAAATGRGQPPAEANGP